VRRTVYRGLETYRYTVVKKVYRSGKHQQVRNDPAEVLTRAMPHLRIVSDELWHAANRASRDRSANAVPTPAGSRHPLTGIPRNSRGPLSGLLICGVCGGKMYMEGRNEGGYRCCNARQGTCWNKATATRDVTHAQIGSAVRDHLLRLEGVLDLMVEEIPRRLLDQEPSRIRLADLQGQEAKLLVARQRLLHAIENGRDVLDALVVRLHDREAELARIRAEMECVQGRSARLRPPPSRQGILEAISRMTNRSPLMDRAMGALLRHLVSPIQAVPYQQFGSNLVVLRARFEVRLIRLLPGQWQALWHGARLGTVCGPVECTPLAVDLFNRPAGPKHFARALELHVVGKSLVKIGEELGIAKRQAHIALQYGHLLKDAGLTDPYGELKGPPEAASRWRTHPKFGKAKGIRDSANSCD
jgi:hypothetical protein